MLIDCVSTTMWKTECCKNIKRGIIVAVITYLHTHNDLINAIC